MYNYREPYEKGEVISLKFKLGENPEIIREFELIDLLGEGSSCLVYLVKNIETKRKMILKEFYPIGYVAKRKEDRSILFFDETMEDPHFLRMYDHFKKSYELLVSFKDDPKTNEYTVGLELEGFAENTESKNAYILQQWGNATTYDASIAGNDLSTAVRYMKHCATALSFYHQKKYLYLDLKWENLLLFQQGSIHLMDFDSILSLNEIQELLRNKKGHTIRTTDIYCPLELKTVRKNEFARLGIETDFYFIGAMLYHVVTGECYQGEPFSIHYDTKYWYERIKDCPTLEVLSPVFKHVLATFLEKTMNPRMKMRYQSDKEVIEALEILEYWSKPGEMTLESSICNPGEVFVGRENEIKEIHRLFVNEKANAVVLFGKGGGGKSALARAYAKRFYKSGTEGMYDTVLTTNYEECNGNLGILIENIFSNNVAYLKGNDEKITAEDKKKFLKAVCRDTKVLLILDNANVAQFDEKILEIGWNVLITTRYEISEFGHKIKLEHLDEGNLCELYKKYYEISAECKKDFQEEEINCIKNMVKACECHILIIELLAKAAGKMNIHAKDLFEGLGLLSKGVEVGYSRDGRTGIESIQNILREVFNVFKNTEDKNGVGYLSTDEIKTLCNLALLRKKMSRAELLEKTDILDNTIDSLYSKGWLEKEDSFERDALYSLQPIIAEVIYEELSEAMDINTTCKFLIDKCMGEVWEMLGEMRIHKKTQVDIYYMDFLRRLARFEDKKAQSGFPAKFMVYVLYYLACWYEKCEDYTNAKMYYQKVRELIEQGVGTDLIEVVNDHLALMTAAKSWELSADELSEVSERIHAMTQKLLLDEKSDAGLLRIVRDYYITMNHTEMVEQLTKKIRQSHHINLGVDKGVMDIYREGIMYMDHEMFNKAVDSFAESRLLLEEQMNNLKKNIAMIDAHYTHALWELGECEKAIRYAEESYRFRRELSSDSEDEKQKIWISLYNWTNALLASGDKVAAQRKWGEAEKEYLAYHKKDDVNYSSLLKADGLIRLSFKDYRRALESLQKAKEIRIKKRKANHFWSVQITREIAAVFEEKGRQTLALGNFMQASDEFAGALVNVNTAICQLKKQPSRHNVKILEELERKREFLMKEVREVQCDQLIRKNTKSEDKPNEDLVYVEVQDKQQGVFILLDGVSRDCENGVYPNPSPAREATRIFAEVCAKNIKDWCYDDWTEMAITEVIRKANEKVAEYNYGLGHEFPAGTVGIVAKVFGRYICYAYIGDCNLEVIDASGKRTMYTKKQTEQVMLHKKELTTKQIRYEICNNAEHSYAYGVWDGNEGAMDMLVCGKIEASTGDTILMYSDGAEVVLEKWKTEEIVSEDLEKIFTQVDIGNDIVLDDRSIIRIRL